MFQETPSPTGATPETESVITLDLLTRNWKQDSYREAYPLDEQSRQSVAKMTPFASAGGNVFLMEGCRGYERGEALFLCVWKVAAFLFAKLGTLSEFDDQFRNPQAAIAA